MAMACSSSLGGKDQTIRHQPAQHHRRACGQRSDTGGVLQIDGDWRSAFEVHSIAQDVAEERAAANIPGKRVDAGVSGRGRARHDLDPLGPDEQHPSPCDTAVGVQRAQLLARRQL